MTASQLTPFALCLLLVTNLWSLWRTIRLVSAEEGLEAKTAKAVSIPETRKAQHALALAGLLIPIFIHVLWVGAIATTLGILCHSLLLARKGKKLSEEINTLHQDTSILSLDLGTTDHSKTGLRLKLWFKCGVESWPLLELQVGVGIHAFPIDTVPAEMLQQFFAPRITDSFGCEKMASIFLNIRANLQEHGVSHPIDIKGWNHDPVIRDMIERILAA